MAENFDNKKRLIDELMREKERAIQKAREDEKEKFEKKIEKMRARRLPASRYRKANERKNKIYLKGKLKKELRKFRLESKRRKQLQELEEKRQKYGKNLSARISRGLTSLANERLRQLRFARTIRKKQFIPIPIQRFIQPLPRPYIPIGWESDPVSRQVERELSGRGMSSLASEGDRMANTLGGEAMFHGNFALPPHSRNISFEAMAHAQAIDLMPSLNLDAEVNAFANILSPRQPVKQFRRFRRFRRR